MKRGAKGFTLVETVLAASLMVLVLAAALSILGTGINWWRRGWERMDAQQNARVALGIMVREIQAAREVGSGSDASTLIIVDATGNQYRYLLAGDSLQRAVKSKGASNFSGYNLLAYGVQALEFGYDRPDPAASTVVTIRLVTRDPRGREFEVTTAASLRLKAVNRGH